jgi:hypothetical protein
MVLNYIKHRINITLIIIIIIIMKNYKGDQINNVDKLGSVKFIFSLPPIIKRYQYLKSF